MSRRQHQNSHLALALAVAIGLLVGGLPGVALAQSAPVETEGYLELSDGTSLRWTKLLPAGDGPFPIILQYSGYNPGNNVRDGSFGSNVDQIVAEGIGVIGVSLRGTGCSGGQFTPFGEDWANDGIEVIDWIADQEWSNGRVGMAGVSYPAIVSLVTAAKQPEHLVAINASVPVTDLYRDVAYPGGAFNQTFAYVWTIIQKYGNFFGLQETAEGDPQCALNYAGQNNPEEITGVVAKQAPFIDDLDRYTEFLTPERLADIQVPALVFSAWQDEQLGARSMYGYEHLDPSRSWVVGTNSDHIGFAKGEWYRQLVTDFFVHHLRDDLPSADFDRPRFMVPAEVRKDASFDAISTFDVFPAPTVTTTLFGQPDGSFGLDAPTADATFGYEYPLPAPNFFVGIDANVGFNPVVYNETYKVPVPENGAAAFTTPVFAQDVQWLGPASLDVWLSSTATDVDLQVSVVEVRPDGNELYVNRGWLRASHRKLDPAKSTATRPWQTHLRADAEPLTAGQPTPMRIEVWPTGHTFRQGSALRVYVEAPVGFTGFRQLEIQPTPAQNTIQVGPDTPLTFAFGRVAVPTALGDAPACDTLLNQPCRTSPADPPPGTMAFGAPSEPEPEPSQAPVPPPAPLPATGGGMALLAIAVVIAGAGLGRRA